MQAKPGRVIGKKHKKKPPRRARQARAKATVEAILTAAARILAAKGWAGFTTNAVAAKAGVSIGSLYEYFPDKQAICTAIMDRHLTRAEEITVARLASLPQNLSPPDLARILVRGFVDLHADDPRLHRVLSSEAPVPPAARRRIARLTETLVAGLADMLRGTVSNPSLSARLMVEAADALTHRWIVDPAGRPMDADALAGELERMFLAYVAAQNGDPARLSRGGGYSHSG